MIILITLILIAYAMVTGAQADNVSRSESTDVSSQSAGSALSISSSTQTQSSGGSDQSEDVKDPYNGLITENRLYLAREEHSQHLIRFYNYGQVQALAQTGTTFELYSKKGGIWPNSSTFRNDYDQKMNITDAKPIVMNVSPGIWVFTVDSPDQEGAFSLGAFQNTNINTAQNAVENQQTSSQSSSVSFQSV